MKKPNLFVALFAICALLSLSACHSVHDRIGDEWKEQQSRKEDVTVKCYGEFGDVHVVLPICGGATGALGEETVDGVDFHYTGAAFPLTVWQSGTFYSLKEAFESGILTHEDLVTVRENHRAEYGFLYETELSGGFASDGEPASPIKVVYTAEKSKLRVGSDLKVKLFYGWVGEPHPDAYGSVTTTFTMRSWVYEGNEARLSRELLLGNLGERFVWQFDEICHWERDHWESDSADGAETVIIPSEWFLGEEGAIGWDLAIRSNDSPQNSLMSGGASLYYIKEAEEITLFGSYYDFSHHRIK